MDDFNRLQLFMIIHHQPVEIEWKRENLIPFNELILSWNAMRPREGKYLFYLSVKLTDWSAWLPYASWGNEGQSSFSARLADDNVRIYQDTLEITNGYRATGFQIKIILEGDASLDRIRSLHISTNGDEKNEYEEKDCGLSSIHLEVCGLSQITLNHPRYADLCSPTSTTAVIRYLSGDLGIDPIHFAEQSLDHEADIFGNWVFNVAQAADQLGEGWDCWVEKLKNIDEIYQRLHKRTPVIVSVKGPLKGAAQSYSNGHLMAVIGFDSLHQQVICMDPAFPSDDCTCVSYALPDFLEAWDRRGKFAYIFSKSRLDL